MVELIIAMIIISTVLLTLMAIQTSALVTIADAQKRQQATAYANQTIEQVRSIPWNTLEKGLAGNFVSAAGGDSNVSGSTLTLLGQTYTLIVAPASGPGSHDLSDPTAVWPPLFDSTGSNRTQNASPEVPGITFDTRAYVVEGPEDGSIGVVAVVTWSDLDSGELHTQVAETVAYAPSGGCGDLNLQPFLSSCQARFTAAANSGTIVTTISANKPAPDDDQAASILPGSSLFEAIVATSEARAAMSSQQVTRVEGELVGGGEDAFEADGDDYSSTFPRGYQTKTAEASDDTSSVGAPPANDAVANVQSSSSGLGFAAPSAGNFVLGFRSDNTLGGAAKATVENACALGPVPAGEPCAQSVISGTVYPYVYLQYTDSSSTNRRLWTFFRETTSSYDSNAWVGRYINNAGSTVCTSVPDEGCGAAGASKDFGTIFIAYPPSAGGWGLLGIEAPNGLVYITGYSDSVSVQRGVDQKTATPTVSRTGTLWYWNGSVYKSQSLGTGVSAFLGPSDIPTQSLSWTASGINLDVTASTTVQVIGGVPAVVSGSDPNCIDEECKVSQNAGTITVTVSYDVVINGSYERTINVVTSINGSNASASYRAARTS